jgi:aldose 1-epimerase
LHGGSRGFHSRVWQVESVNDGAEPGLVLTHVSRDGEQGYPGNLEARVVYSLTDDGLRMDFSATTDRRTVVNMTNHSYFNLSGRPGSDCLGHVLTIPARRYIETDRELIPTGRLAEVDGTPLDFTGGASMGSRIEADFPALAIGQGYDHFFVLDDDSEGVKLAASVHEPASGRGMEVWTTKPGVQFYSGNHIPEGLAGMDGAVYGKRFGFCLEAQGFVDAPNRAGFPSVVLEPGAVYRQSIMYKFFVK